MEFDQESAVRRLEIIFEYDFPFTKIENRGIIISMVYSRNTTIGTVGLINPTISPEAFF